MAHQKIIVEMRMDVMLSELKLVRSALNAAEHPDHSVARAELKEAADAYKALLKSVDE